MMIKYICLNFYSLSEKFTKHGQKLMLKNEKSIKYIGEWPRRNTAYGNDAIDFKDESIVEYQWSFTNHTSKEWSWIAIGIDASNRKWIGTDFTDKDINVSKFYACVFNEMKRGASLWCNSISGREQSPIDFNKDSPQQITMTLNTTLQKLKFRFNGKDLPVYFTNIDKKVEYNMAVVLDFEHHTVSLTQFCIQHK